MSQEFVAVSCVDFENIETHMMAKEGSLFDGKERREWRTVLENIAHKTSPGCNEAYFRYASLPAFEQERAKKAAKSFVGKSGAQNFDDALVWLACFDFDEEAMKKAIHEWTSNYNETGGQQ